MNDYFNNIDNVSNGSELFNFINNYDDNSSTINKLSKQGGNNMNFNKCSYDISVNPNDLFDIYNGFIRGNIFPNLYNQYKLSRPFDIKPINSQAELLTKVDAYCFFSHDLNLYLDTHPDDDKMINLFKEVSADADMAVAEYEDKFGPLFSDSSKGFPWTWNKSPWPWEND